MNREPEWVIVIVILPRETTSGGTGRAGRIAAGAALVVLTLLSGGELVALVDLLTR